MSRVRAKDTRPEMKLRSLIHGMGFRYRLHVSELPGKPDLVFPKYSAVVFMHGCFWHRHEGCKLARLPKSHLEFWRTKLEGNKERDRRNIELLRGMGWRILVVWECSLKDLDKVAQRVQGFLLNPDEVWDEVD